jgi:uncharacterized protein (DUF427 family)
MPADTTTAQTTQRGRVRVEHSQKRVRTYLGGELVADTTRPVLVWEIPYYPAYYIHADDVVAGHLVPTETVKSSPSRGEAHHFTVKAGGKEAVDAAWTYPDSPLEELRDLIRFDWGAMGSWFEEDEEVFTHPRDPYKRIDALPSSRHVQVEVNGVLVADSHRPTILFETSLPPRYYLPQPDVRMDLLTPTDTSSSCPYKGTARYWSVRAGDDVVADVAWSYRTPLPESIKVAGLVAFYNERVDLRVDGELLERPRTPFS